MDAGPNTVYLRLEGPLQAWGDTSKLVIRRTMEAPTKSGVLGLVACAMGRTRDDARHWLPELNALAMGVRIDRPGTRWWDYHTVGARVGVLKAEGGIKVTQTTKEPETLVSRREYLCDASFLVALQGATDLVRRVAHALSQPAWAIYLGRRSCPPAVPVAAGASTHASLAEALAATPWRPRLAGDEGARQARIVLPCILEWGPTETEPIAPLEAEVWYDRAVSLEPAVHEPRLVVRKTVDVPVGRPAQARPPSPPRPRADYRDSEYRRRRVERLAADSHLCVFCKSPATTVQHITYRRAGGHERQDDLRSLCRLCHDAVTMIEYGLGMGLDRINPEDPQWREQIVEKRAEIIRFRALESRRRRLAAEEVE